MVSKFQILETSSLRFVYEVVLQAKDCLFSGIPQIIAIVLVWSSFFVMFHKFIMPGDERTTAL